MYTVHSYTTRGSTCPVRRHKIVKGGIHTNTSFGSYHDARKYCGMQNLKLWLEENRLHLDQEAIETLVVLD
jgi:hypothetical protein